MRKLILAVLMIGLCLTTDAKTPWTSKPPIGSQIDWGHPLSKGLVGCWLMNEGGGGKVVDLVARNNGVLTNVSWSQKEKGLMTYSSGSSSNYIVIPSSTKYDSLPCTIVFNFSITNLTNYPAITGRCGPANSNTGFNVHIEGSTLAADGKSATNNSLAIRTTKTLLVNTLYDSAIVFTNAGQGSGYIYINGKQEGSGTASISWGFNNQSVYLFKVDDTFWNPREMRFGYFYWFNRILKPEEIRQLSQDPYCFIKPPSNWSMLKTAVAGAVSSWRRKIWFNSADAVGGF